jgi:hypothetical protein
VAIRAALADVCSWGNSRHSAASRRSGHVSEGSSEGLRRPLGTASRGNARPLPPGYSVHAFQAHIGLALGRSAPERHGSGRHSSPARPESCSVGRSLLDLAVQRGAPFREVGLNLSCHPHSPTMAWALSLTGTCCIVTFCSPPVRYRLSVSIWERKARASLFKARSACSCPLKVFRSRS